MIYVMGKRIMEYMTNGIDRIDRMNHPGWRSIPKKEYVMWYVIQTITGKEMELVLTIEKVLAKDGYKKCFVPKKECVWRLEGRYRIHFEPLFSSYVFVETDTPERFFIALKRVPKLTKLLGSDGIFWSVRSDEERVLRELMRNDPDSIIRRPLVKININGELVFEEKILEKYAKMIVKKRMRKRSIVLEIPFLGEKKKIQLGIQLEDDNVIIAQ